MGDFERTFGAGADVEKIIDDINRFEQNARSQGKRFPPPPPGSRVLFFSFFDANEWAKTYPGATITRAPMKFGAQHFTVTMPPKFPCHKEWGQLADTELDNVRHCGDCDKKVFLCESKKELADSIRQERCIAVKKSVLDQRVKAPIAEPEDYILGGWEGWEDDVEVLVTPSANTSFK